MKKIGRRLFIALPLGVLAASLVTTPAAANERYIVSGASGQLGELVVRELLRRGVPAQDLILVSRTPDKLAEFAKLGASVREGDVEKPETLVPAYTGGTHMLMISLGFGRTGREPRSVLHKRAFDAAVKAGVKHIVYTSFVGADMRASPIGQDHRLSEESLRASGAQWTILRNGEYADLWILAAARKMIASGRAEVPPDEKPSAPVTHEDCAAAAVGAMLNSKAVNQVYEITGPALVTFADIARATSEVTGRKIDLVPGSAAAQAPSTLPPPDAAAGPLDVPANSNDVPQFTVAQIAANAARFKQLTGRDLVGLKQMLEAHKAQLLKK